MRSRSLTRRLSRNVVGSLREPRYPLAERAGYFGRSGATLTEVLMAILIMAVGVVSVFTLFPISVIRTIQATNQTNAKILKQNVEQQIAQSPEIMTKFGVGPLFNGEEWRPVTDYVAGEIIVPTIKAGSAIPRPLAFYQASANGTSGLTEPTWNTGGNTADGSVTWQNIAQTRYVVDPLGWNAFAADAPAIRDQFGNKTNRISGVTSPLGVRRINGGITSLLSASQNATHPDSWQNVLQATPSSITDAVPAGPTNGIVTFPPAVDLSGISGSALAAPRIVLTTLDGKLSATRGVTGINAATGEVNWNALEPMPARFPLTDVGTARIEVFNRRYSWFMTVRSVGAQPEIKCVITFNRGFATADEHVYATNFGNPDIDLNQSNGADLNDGLTATNQVMIAWQPDATAGWDPEGTGDFTNEPDPLLKPGNWLFDARDVSWYRIQSIDVEAPAGARPQWKVLSVDRPVRVITPDDNSGPPDNAMPPGRAILMPGIVEVFDL